MRESVRCRESVFNNNGPSFHQEPNNEELHLPSRHDAQLNNDRNRLFSFENSSDLSNIANESDHSRTMDSDIFDEDILASTSFSWCSDGTPLSCRACRAFFVDLNDLISHYVNSSCGSLFKTHQSSSSHVERVRILTVSQTPPSSSHMPPEVRSELQELVQQYLERNGIDVGSESEDDKKVLKVVVDKLASPDKPSISSGPASTKRKSAEPQPKRKFRASKPEVEPETVDDTATPGSEVRNHAPVWEAPCLQKSPVFRPGNLPRLSSEVSPVVQMPAVSTTDVEKKRIGRPKGVTKSARKNEGNATLSDSSTAPKQAEFKAATSDVAGVDPGDSDVQHLCDICDYSTASADDLQNHYGKTHQLSVCETCNFKVSDPLALETHLKTHSDFYCEECDQRFYSGTRYAQHRKTHGSNRPFQCDICCHLFPSKHQLLIHLRTHMSDTRRYFCKHCPRGYTSIAELRKHMSRHQYKTLMCGICGQVCDSYTMLDAHKQTHIIVRDKGSGDAKYQCAVCFQGFTNIKKMRQHLTTHKYGSLPRHAEKGKAKAKAKVAAAKAKTSPNAMKIKTEPK